MSTPKAKASRLYRADTDAGFRGWAIRNESTGDPLEAQLARPGLWQFGRRGTAATDRGVKLFLFPDFDRLASLAGGGAQVQDAESLEHDFRAWARATSRGKLPEGWVAPSRDEASAWFTAERLTVRAGPHLSKGIFECDSKGLRIVFPELVRLGGGLPKARRAWARELCFDAQSKWHMVRFGLEGCRVRAEVDLSGVPAEIAQPLFTFAFEALVFSVKWVLPSLALISDPSAASQVLDRGPWWRTQEEILASHPGSAQPSEGTVG